MKHNPTKQVRAILERVPATRKSDARLIAYVWADTIGFDKLNATTAKDVLDMMSEGKLQPLRAFAEHAKERNSLILI